MKIKCNEDAFRQIKELVADNCFEIKGLVFNDISEDGILSSINGFKIPFQLLVPGTAFTNEGWMEPARWSSVQPFQIDGVYATGWCIAVSTATFDVMIHVI